MLAKENLYPLNQNYSMFLFQDLAAPSFFYIQYFLFKLNFFILYCYFFNSL